MTYSIRNWATRINTIQKAQWCNAVESLHWLVMERGKSESMIGWQKCCLSCCGMVCCFQQFWKWRTDCKSTSACFSLGKGHLTWYYLRRVLSVFKRRQLIWANRFTIDAGGKLWRLLAVIKNCMGKDISSRTKTTYLTWIPGIIMFGTILPRRAKSISARTT